MFEQGVGQDASFAYLGVDGGQNSPLVQMLLAPAIVPGSEPGYELCKTINAYHPLGSVLTDAPITLAQSQGRKLAIPVPGEDRLIERFQDVWDTIGPGPEGGISATTILHNLLKTSRIYGIASLAVGERGKDPSKPLDLANIADAEIFFNVLDPLNTAGSLVLNQDPNSPDFLKPKNVVVNGVVYHRSRVFVKMNEQPLYIEYTAASFGFVGRSIYQRALYPLKSYLQSTITDDMVTKKVGLLVAKLKSPGSFIDNVMKSFAAWKRAQIKSGVTGQVLQIGPDEDIESLNFQNLEGPYKLARENIIKNIASACGMPATLIAQETMSAELHEGTEDAKKEAAYLNFVRGDAQPAYDFMDRIVMRRAWTQEFYESLKTDFPDYRRVPYETAVHDWFRKFSATWPNLLEEPDSEKAKSADVQFKAVIAAIETLAPELDPGNKAKLLAWACENFNERKELFASKLDIDIDDLEQYLEENRENEVEAAKKMNEEPTRPKPFSAAS